MGDKLVIIAEYGNSFEARMAKMKLAQHDIESVVTGEDLLMVLPKVGIPKVELRVMDDKAEQAIKILDSAEKQEQ